MEMALQFETSVLKAATKVATTVHLTTRLHLIMMFGIMTWRLQLQNRLLTLHPQDPQLLRLQQLQPPPQHPLLQRELRIVTSTHSMAWGLESSHVLVRGTISSQHAFITQIWNPSRMRKSLLEPSGRRGVLPRHQGPWYSHRAGEGRRRLQPARA